MINLHSNNKIRDNYLLSGKLPENFQVRNMLLLIIFTLLLNNNYLNMDNLSFNLLFK